MHDEFFLKSGNHDVAANLTTRIYLWDLRPTYIRSDFKYSFYNHSGMYNKRSFTHPLMFVLLSLRCTTNQCFPFAFIFVLYFRLMSDRFLTFFSCNVLFDVIIHTCQYKLRCTWKFSGLRYGNLYVTVSRMNRIIKIIRFMRSIINAYIIASIFYFYICNIAGINTFYQKYTNFLNNKFV